MRALVIAVVLAGAGAASAQPSGGVAPAPTPAAAGPITIRIDRALGDFDPSILTRALRKHAAACRRRGARGDVRLELLLQDRGDRRGMRVRAASGDARLRRCLGRSLPAATWPTGHLDAYAAFTVTIRVAP